MKKVLKVTCDTKLNIPLENLHGIQGTLKMMTSENYEKYRKRILKDGLNFNLSVWKEVKKSKGKSVVKWWIIDGHGCHAICKVLRDDEGYACPPLPCVEIYAPSFEEAKERVLGKSSSFHTMTGQGLYEYSSGMGLKFEQLKEYQLTEIDLIEHKMEFYTEAAEKAEAGDKEKVTFDAYKNASVKQVVLYFASEQYEKVIKLLDQQVEKMGVGDYSEVVWRWLNGKGASGK